ncbi:hypothetical protein PV772_17100 [Pseudarthrobacter sp. CC12]|uniref:hypothetical protein n=1 Tax=Pseudarthrobacter sp. CC12 TaxID=3029193 RepID=UPI00326794DC
MNEESQRPALPNFAENPENISSDRSSDQESAPYSRVLDAIRLEERQEISDYEVNIQHEGYEDRLREALTQYSSETKFEPGDLVQWKTYMRDAIFPYAGAPAIVVSYLDDPITTLRDGMRLPEPRNLVLGYLDGANEFVIGFYSSRRFTQWNQVDTDNSPGETD